MKRWIMRHKIWSALIIVAVSYLVVASTIQALGQDNQANNLPTTQATLAAQQSACTLDGHAFMATVNQWRSAVGSPALAYSPQLQSVAQSRIADMVQYSYYGHENPQTKQSAVAFLTPLFPPGTATDEVLDGSNNAVQSVTNFKNSPDHYQALIDAQYTYFGALAVYQPESWADYDNSGNLQTPAGKNQANCLVVGELADKPAN